MIGWRGLALAGLCLLMTGCGFFDEPEQPVFAPGIAGEAETDGLVVGHRLMAAGEYELALRA